MSGKIFMMKKYFNVFPVLTVLFLLSGGCEKEDIPATVLYVTIANIDTYRLSLGTFGDEEGCSITQNALHASSSRILGQPWEPRVYEYIPDPGYTGPDKVLMHTERGSDGASENDEIEIIEINFTIITSHQQSDG